jgi:hypothetical protein
MANVKDKVHFGKISTDSFKLRMPLSIVTVLDKNLTSSWLLVNNETGEIDSNFNKKNSFKFSKNGISTYYAIEQQRTKEGHTKSFLTILINSKHLLDNYFEGITKDNIQQIYNSIITQKVVYFSFKDLMTYSACTDVDFKKDGLIKLYDALINECRNRSKQSTQKDKGYRFFNKRDNKGIEWSTRKTTSYKSNPFLKIYHKEIELNNNSFDFSNKYLKNIIYNDVVRIETTVKNNDHFKYLGIENNSLSTILHLTTGEKNHIINNALKLHLEPRVNKPKDNSKMTPTETLFFGFEFLLGLVLAPYLKQ